MSVQPLVSIVCPAYKEEEVLPLFHRHLSAVLAHLEPEYRVEILYIDDGSPDGTLQVMKKLAAEDPRAERQLLQALPGRLQAQALRGKSLAVYSPGASP